MAMSSIAGGEPRLAGLLARRAHIYLQHHLQHGQIDELDQAIANLQSAVDLAKSGPQREHLGSMLNMLGVLSLRRYARNANEAVLDDALHRFSWALECFSVSHSQRVISLAGIAQTRANRYDRTGAMLDLEEAISQIRTAIDIQRHFNDTDLLATILSNLGCILWRRYQRTGSSENLHEAFTAITKAAAAVSPDNAGLLGSIWTNLAGLLARQYEITGMLDHLRNAVFEAREVAHAAPESPELDSLLSLLGKLARCEHARRDSASEKTTPSLLSFYSGTLILSTVVILSVVTYSHSRTPLYPVVFLIGVCCSGVTSQLYRESKEETRLSRYLGYTPEPSNTLSEAIPKILDLPLFDDRLFETIQGDSRFEKDVPIIKHPVNVAQTDDCTITEREDVYGNNEKNHHTGNTHHAGNTRHALNKSNGPSFHDREAVQSLLIKKQNPRIAVSKPAQKNQAQILNTVPAHINIEQTSKADTAKVITESKFNQTPERVHNVNVTGKLSTDPSSYIAPEQLSSIRLPSGSPSKQTAGGGARNITSTKKMPHAPAALRDAEKKEVDKKLRNFDLPNLESQQDARGEDQELIAANQGYTTHDIHKNEGNAMGNLFSRRANVVGHISRHYGDKYEVNHYTVSGDSTNATGAKIPTALSSQLPPSESSSKVPSKPSIIDYTSLAPSDPLSKALVPFPERDEELLDKLSRAGPPRKKDAAVSPNAERSSKERPPFDQEREWSSHVRDRSRPRNPKKWDPMKRDPVDESADFIYSRMKYNARRKDTESPTFQASIVPQAGCTEESDSSIARHKRVPPPPPRDGNEKLTRPLVIENPVVRPHRLRSISRRPSDHAGPLGLFTDSSSQYDYAESPVRVALEYIELSKAATNENRPVLGRR